MITPSLSSSTLLQHMCVFSIILLLFWDFEGIKNHSWCIAGSLSPCTSNLFVLRCLLCSKKPANWPIFKFYISNVFLSKFYFPAPCSAYFQLGTGKQENSYFNWILLNIFFSGLSARCASQTKPISVHFYCAPTLGKRFLLCARFYIHHVSCIMHASWKQYHTRYKSTFITRYEDICQNDFRDKM